MSLSIQLDDVAAVLLADGWHEVSEAHFDLDSYEYLSGDHLLHGGGDNGITAIGFWLQQPDGKKIAGPLSSILAVRLN